MTSQPIPEEALSRLSEVMVKVDKHASRKPKFQLVRVPVLNADAFYLLPQKQSEAWLRVLPL